MAENWSLPFTKSKIQTSLNGRGNWCLPFKTFKQSKRFAWQRKLESAIQKLQKFKKFEWQKIGVCHSTNSEIQKSLGGRK